MKMIRFPQRILNIDDNYPLALIVANIAQADFIVIKMEMNGKYLIVPGGNHTAMVVDGETELQEKIESFCQVMIPEMKPGKYEFSFFNRRNCF